MNYYIAHRICCPTCNGQIAAYAEEFEQLQGTGMNKEEAMNAMKIDRYCCRYHLTNPTYVFFNMQNRYVVEDVKNDPKMYVNSPNPSLDPSMIMTNINNPSKPMGIAVSSLPQAGPAQPVLVTVDLPGLAENFEKPVLPNVPTINPSKIQPFQTINVGTLADPKYAKEITGRTYFAR